MQCNNRYIDISELYHTSRHFAKKFDFLVTFDFIPHSCHRDVSVGKNQAKHDCEHAIIDSREMEIRDRLNIQDMLSIYIVEKLKLFPIFHLMFFQHVPS